MKPDRIVNGWHLFAQGCGWGYNVYVVHACTGRRESNFTSLDRAASWCESATP